MNTIFVSMWVWSHLSLTKLVHNVNSNNTTDTSYIQRHTHGEREREGEMMNIEVNEIIINCGYNINVTLLHVSTHHDVCSSWCWLIHYGVVLINLWEWTQSNSHSYLVCLLFTLWPFLCLVTFLMFFITYYTYSLIGIKFQHITTLLISMWFHL